MMAPSLSGLISNICLMSLLLAGSHRRRWAAFSKQNTLQPLGVSRAEKRNFIHNLSCCYGNLLIFYWKISEAWPLVKLLLSGIFLLNSGHQAPLIVFYWCSHSVLTLVVRWYPPLLQGCRVKLIINLKEKSNCRVLTKSSQSVLSLSLYLSIGNADWKFVRF